MPIDEIEREIEDSEAITAKIIEAKHRIQSALKEATRGHDVRSPSVAPESSATKPRLPKLTLQRFRGENPGSITHVLVNTTDGKADQVRLDKIIKCTRYSSLNKLLRVTGVVLKFKSSLQNGCHGEGVELPVHKNHLTGQDMDKAEVLWLCSIQAKSFSTELLYLKSKCKQVPPVRVNQFGLFVDDLGPLKPSLGNVALSTSAPEY